MTTFTFQNHALKAHTIAGQTWFESADIAAALDYANPRSVTGIYANYKNEFTEGMTKVLESSTLGFVGVRPEVLESSTSANLKARKRVFSLRGVHLIAMLARTPVAEDFRKWVLDLIEKEEKRGSLPPVVKRRGAYTKRNADLPAGVYHNQSKYNPYRATVWDGKTSVHVGSYPTVDDAVAAIEHFQHTGVVQRLQTARTAPHISIAPLAEAGTPTAYKADSVDFVNHVKVLLEAAQLLALYPFGKDLSWDLIAFAQEEAQRTAAH